MKVRVATVAFLTATAAAASGADLKGPDLGAGKKIATQVCAACHGVDGQSQVPVNPNLAGQHAAYVAKQLADFKANKDRKNAVMLSMAQPLSVDEMRAVAAYYAAQKPKLAAARDQELVNLGEKLYRGGNSTTGVPACAGCHGPTGAGIPAQYPRLSGQFVEYTVSQLKAFRTLERANDPNRMMRSIAARMTDQEIAAVAEYIVGLR